MESGAASEGREFPASLLAVRSVIALGGGLTRATARGAGLRDTDVLALEALAAGPMGPADLARRLGLTTAAATGLVDRLVERGHAVRRPDDHDRRRVGVSLTDSGFADIRARLMVTLDAMLAWDAAFNDDERAVVERYLSGVIAALEAATAEATAPPQA